MPSVNSLAKKDQRAHVLIESHFKSKSYLDDTRSGYCRQVEDLTLQQWTSERSLLVDEMLWVLDQPFEVLARCVVVGHWALPP